jgi:esterase/lipase superfamily enzyme
LISPHLVAHSLLTDCDELNGSRRRRGRTNAPEKTTPMKKSPLFIGLALVMFALSGCGGRPHGTLVPIGPLGAEIPGAGRVDMLVATTRSTDGAQPGEMFSGNRADAPYFADIAISIPPNHAQQVGEVQWPRTPPGDPATEFVTLHADVLSRDEAIRRFDARIRRTPDRHVLVFVHGYNTRFEEAVYRFAQIVHDTETTALPVLFTWPSRGRLLSYGYDHESASYSRDALDELLRGLAKDNSVREISVLAHSMGNWVTLEALRQMAIRDKGLPPKLKDVMLAAPDVDYDVFRRQIAKIGAHPSLFTVFVSRNDEALAASRRFWGGRRLGAVDIRQENYEQEFKREDITPIDLSNVTSDDFLGHGTYAQSPLVVRAIGRRLTSGQTLTDAQTGFGDRLGQVAAGAGSAVGSAAGMAVSAPFALFDERARDNLNDRAEELGAHVGETVDSGANAVAAPLK